MSPPASRTRTTLIVSFGVMVLLLAITGAAAFITLDRIQKQDSDLQRRLLESRRALERVRSGVYLAGIFARDYFVSPEPELLDRLHALRDDTLSALGKAPATPETSSLRGEIEAYWKVLDLMADMARRGQSAATGRFFRGQLQQRRDTMMQIAEAAARAGEDQARLTAEAFEQRRSAIRATATGLLAAALAGGMLLAAFTIRRLLQLERETQSFASRLLKAQEDERRAIARELHDGVGQSLSALLIDAGPAVRLAGEQALESVRRLALSLRPSMLDDLGLLPALEWQAREAARRTGIPVRVEAQGDIQSLTEESRTCLYRIAQEALTNACRHSGARSVLLMVRRDGGRVTLCVQDDGAGFDTARQRGLGLLGMEERARRAGAHLRLDSQPGQGTRVTLELPERAA